MRASLWDLKRVSNAKAPSFLDIMRASLWDLKQAEMDDRRILNGIMRAIPMGFETAGEGYTWLSDSPS